MDNFLLNNTSIYLGGQCQWDIVLKNENNELVIDGFQLAPISSNIAYNRKGDIRSLNNNHSDTFKQYCQRLKESFWKDKESPTFYTLENGDEKTYIEYDQTLLAGLKRIPYYDIYKKQYCFFQPTWIEYIPEGTHLRFKFTAYPKGKPNSVLGARVLDLCLSDNDNNDFHNKFIGYLNNWMKSIKIVGGDGNDRTMYVDLKDRSASISGVSTATGQLNNKINCDYLITNLLMIERPNIEVDYILSTLFKAHNTVTSQLFNFNFCFDLNDIIDTYIYQQLYGERIYVKCEMFLVNDETNKIIQTYETRSLFTNYNKINKLSYNPFIFLDDMRVLETGLLEQHYSIEPEDGQSVEYNALGYLKDNEIEGIKDINKISQNICHWDYNDKLNKNFNLYNGYRYIYDNYEINDIRHTENTDGEVVYKYYPLEISYSNGVSIPSLAKNYTYNGELSWAYPKQLFYINSNIDPTTADDIYNNVNETLNKKLYNKGPRGILYENSISVKGANNTWGTNIEIPNTSVNSITCVYIKTDFGGINAAWSTNDDSDSIEKVLKRFYTTKELIQNDPGLIFCVDGNTGVFFTNKAKYLLLENIISVVDNISGSDPITIKLNEAKSVLKKIKESINNGNDGGFYQFGTEICVGQEVVEKDVYYKYYKSDSRTTYLYRTGGKLRPSFITSDSEDFNEYYVYNTQDQTISPLTDNETKNMYEVVLQGDGWRVFIANELRFNLSKDLYDTTPLKDMIKDYLNYIYKLNNDQTAINEIYNMYFVAFDYEYIYNDKKTEETGRTEATVVYDIKLTLR